MNIKLFFNILSKFLLSFFLGLVIAIFFFKNSPIVRQEIAHRLNPIFRFLLESNISYKIEKMDLFPLRFELTQVSTHPHKGNDWSWSCSKLTIGCSWFDFLLYGTLSLSLELDDLVADTAIDQNGPCILEHVIQLYQGAVYLPTFLQSFKIKNGQFTLHEQNTQTDVDLQFFVRLKTVDNAMKGTINISDSCACMQGKTIFEQLKGSVRFDLFGYSGNPKLMIRPHCTAIIPQLREKKRCHISGEWRYDHGLFSIKNDDQSFLVGPVKLYFVGDCLFAESISRFPILYLYRLFFDAHEDFPLEGVCTLKLHVDCEHAFAAVRGELTTDEVTYGQKTILSAGALSFSRRGKRISNEPALSSATCPPKPWRRGKRVSNVWKGTVFAVVGAEKKMSGTGEWNEAECAGHANISNCSALFLDQIPYWLILPNKLNLRIERKQDSTLCAIGECVVTHKKIGSDYACTGQATWIDDQIQIEGYFDEQPFCPALDTKPRIDLLHCRYGSQDEAPLIFFEQHKTDTDRFVGIIAFPFIKRLLSQTGCDLHADGALQMQVAIKNGKLCAQIDLNDGTVRLPYIYNFLHRFHARAVFDPFARVLTVRDLSCAFHRGRINCKRAVLQLNENYELTFAHVPVLFQDCLLNWQKDLFAVLSGQVTFKKEKDFAGCLRGRLCVDRSQLKQNIFSSDFQRQLFSFSGSMLEGYGADLSFDLQIKTKEPVRVKTSFLQTNAHIDLLCAGTFSSPDISGTVSFSAGSLSFPYKPLHLTTGVIEFLPGQLDAPVVEFVAKNKLKKYNVSLHVAGLLHEPAIILESSPPLSEEQIISLLLAGSEQESLNILMPALIMQNLKHIMFGSEQTRAGMRTAFGRLFNPLKRVHFVPSFADQTGRGGLRGAIEIDISERWRAMIQKNFSLTEDTRFEAEYLLSDDISLLAVRDERGDISAEVEMRWKF